MFRQYVNQGDINPCIIVDDIIRSGLAIEETVELVRGLGAPIIGCGAIVRFSGAPPEIAGVPIKSLVEFDAKFYDTGEACTECEDSAPEEYVRF
jgi:orotate phosphoribosyltransferase-like protein